MKKLAASLLLGFLGAQIVLAVDGYLAPASGSPPGNDFNSGLDAGHPKLTFGQYNKKRPPLGPGDTLWLADGTYPIGNVGFLNGDCGNTGNTATWQNGTAGHPVTIQAINERQAHLTDDGSHTATLRFTHCSYISVVGLQISSADRPGTFKAGTGEPLVMNDVDHPIIRRNLLDHDNRYANTNCADFIKISYGLIEENEGYYCHGTFLQLYSAGTNYNVIRRNYSHGRGYGDVCSGADCGVNCYCTGNGANFPDELLVLYPGTSNIVENNISEKRGYLIDIEPTSQAANNQILGNINLDGHLGIVSLAARGNTSGRVCTGTFIQDNIGIRDGRVDYWFRAAKTTMWNRNTSLASPGSGFSDVTAGYKGDGIYSNTGTNNAMIGTGVGTGYYYASPPVSATFTLDHSWATGFGTNFDPRSSNAYITYSNTATTNPGYGSCYAWLPDGAAGKGAGSGGQDIGASILYRYQNGILTSIPLWSTGPNKVFPHGATVTGLNDHAGDSLFDIGNRLNINRNGCSFPARYNPTPTGTITPTVHADFHANRADADEHDHPRLRRGRPPSPGRRYSARRTTVTAPVDPVKPD